MRRFALGFIVCVWAGAVAAGAGAQPAQPRARAVPAQPPAKPAAPPEGYAYDAGRRRDPFVSLVGTGAEPPRLMSKKGEGAAGLTVSEISVRGVIESRGAFVAMVQGPDTKTFLVHPGDKFVDGTLRAITAQGLVIVQEVNDPRSLVKQREIRKLLRSFETVKE